MWVPLAHRAREDKMCAAWSGVEGVFEGGVYKGSKHPPSPAMPCE